MILKFNHDYLFYFTGFLINSAILISNIIIIIIIIILIILPASSPINCYEINENVHLYNGKIITERNNDKLIVC